VTTTSSKSKHAGAVATPEDLALTEDASLRRIWVPIAVSSALSLVVAFTDSLSLGGLAIRLTSGIETGETEFLGKDLIASFPVIIGLIVLTFFINLANTMVREHAIASWDAARRVDLIRAFRAADFPVQQSYSGAGLSAAIEQIGKANSLVGATVGLINTTVRAVIYMGAAVVVSWRVSVIVLLAGGTLMVGLRQITRRTRKMHREMAGRFIFVGEEIGDMAGSARELHLLNRWQESEDFLRSEVSSIRRLRYVSASMAGMVAPIYWMGTLLVGVAVAAGASTGGSTTGVAASGLLLIRAMSASQGAQMMYQSFNDARPYVERVRALIASLRRAERTASIDDPAPGTVVEVAGASLSYGGNVVVADLDLRLEGPGGIALVGPSGSGKSTTLLALSGLSRPVAGTVSVDGVPLEVLSGAALGATVGLLPQDPKVLRGSLRANLVRPELERTDEELWTAIEAVGLQDTVAGFSGKLDSPVGRAAEGFSGGEMQRLGLARLLVNQPSVWLVDEPTSALDRENSERVLRLLGEAMADHLVVVVTHRPELLHQCKRVVFMEDGVILDDGTLDEVVSRQPFVAAMVAESSAQSA